MKTKVLLVLVLGLGIGFGFALGLIVLPEKAAAEISDKTAFKRYTPHFFEWANLMLEKELKRFLRTTYRLKGPTYGGGKWEVHCYPQRSGRDHYLKMLQGAKDITLDLCAQWKEEGYDIEFGRDIEWEIHWE